MTDPISEWQAAVAKTIDRAKGYGYPMSEQQAQQAIATATGELLLAWLGEDEDASQEAVWKGKGDTAYDQHKMTRNRFRHELRAKINQLEGK